MSDVCREHIGLQDKHAQQNSFLTRSCFGGMLAKVFKRRERLFESIFMERLMTVSRQSRNFLTFFGHLFGHLFWLLSADIYSCYLSSSLYKLDIVLAHMKERQLQIKSAIEESQHVSV